MNYIKQLEQQRARALASTIAVNRTIGEQRAHLTTDKFREDTTIQVADVDRMLLTVSDAFMDSRYASDRLMATASITISREVEDGWRRGQLQPLAGQLERGLWDAARLTLRELSASDRASIPQSIMDDIDVILGEVA